MSLGSLVFAQSHLKKWPDFWPGKKCSQKFYKRLSRAINQQLCDRGFWIFASVIVSNSCTVFFFDFSRIFSSFFQLTVNETWRRTQFFDIFSGKTLFCALRVQRCWSKSARGNYVKCTLSLSFTHTHRQAHRETPPFLMEAEFGGGAARHQRAWS